MNVSHNELMHVREMAAREFRKATAVPVLSRVWVTLAFLRRVVGICDELESADDRIAELELEVARLRVLTTLGLEENYDAVVAVWQGKSWSFKLSERHRAHASEMINRGVPFATSD